MNTVDEKEPEASDLADAAVRKAVEEVKTSEKEVPDDLVLPEEDGITTDQIEESAVAKDFRIILKEANTVKS